MQLNVLILAHNFPPEFGGGATMQFELARHLAAAGHKVIVIAPLPSHHMISNDGSMISTEEVVEGVHVIRIKTPSSTITSILSRAFCELGTDFRLVMKGLHIKPVDILFIMPQTSFLAIFSKLIKWFRKSIIVLYLQDLYPEVLISMGLLSRKNLIFRAAKIVEKIAYHGMDYIGVHSPRNRSYVISCGIDEKKVNVIPLWVDTSFIEKHAIQKSFAEKNHLTKKFVVMYAGTVGFAMGSRTIPQTAKLLENEADLQFVVVGGGSKIIEMKEEIERLDLRNILVLPPQPRRELPDVLASCDLLLVLLRKEQSDNPNGYFRAVIPHKLLSNMASGKPILLSAEVDSDAAELIRNSKCGSVVPPEDPVALAEAVLAMMQDREKLPEWGQNGLEFVKNQFDSATQVKRMEDLFVKLIDKSAYSFNDPWYGETELITKPE